MPDPPEPSTVVSSVPITTRFERVLREVEDGLAVALAKARAETTHPGKKGTKVEIAARAVLREYMPPNLAIGHGGVYDSYDDESAQMDVVIANGDQPFTFPDGSGEYVIEGVSAVGEIKSKLTSAALADCIAKGNKYKQLRPIFGYQDQVTNMSDFMRECDMIPPFFVLALESNMKMETILEKLSSAALVTIPSSKPCPQATPQPPLDAVCVLGKGLALYQRSSVVSPLFHIITTGKPFQGWYALNFSVEHTPLLASLLAWLHTTMPRQLRRESVVREYFIPSVPAARYMVEKQSKAP